MFDSFFACIRSCLVGIFPGMHPITKWRKDHPRGRITCAKLGEWVGVSEAEISRWENGLRRIPPHQCKVLEKITGIPKSVLRPDVYDETSEAA